MSSQPQAVTLEGLVRLGKERGASDLHLEPGLPAALRIRGALSPVGEPLAARTVLGWANEIIGEQDWPGFEERWSWDASQRVSGVRCRINILRSPRGVGMAIRLLSSAPPTLRTLNLHPDLVRFISAEHGLVLVSGPTGSGKSSTLAALLQEINLREARHLLTIESPIEYDLIPRHSFIRQREVGRDTPSFRQALLDAVREDPDVLMVGELREPETMQLTLNAAETGHLVLATVHSGNVGEALQRIVAAFPSESQAAVTAQLADCLVGVVCQQLRYREDLKIRVPECEILAASSAIRAIVRQGNFFKLTSALESGGPDGCWTWARYREWLARRSDWYSPAKEEPEPERPEPVDAPPLPHPPVAKAKPQPGPRVDPGKTEEPGVLVISSPEEDLDSIVSEMERRAGRKKGS
ncbi:MAG TPA: ATPase, T2SS/T4P/T4SS family [Myxococcaceae bacterium]|nr:ATPase, T2SS/T4P/T4SS family [Myxococcaceae bacterium]